jgi:hypothetical protein
MSLEQDPLIVDIKAKINDEITRLNNSVTNGSCVNFDSYKRLTGKIEGLRLALDSLDGCIKNYMNDEDE